ncbi:hypothetical protein Bpfe_006574 [Biomphalaria pfeifferi]|uniref:Uncharacterized protein n=1 Tax=Biomphalaria pfeifferi TaxID=112525 RepID=A0AAD8FI14_BIOPF|nr:hypothetical protein Bpfe_006574 [Biomphalaria pfeifferi]
MATLLPSSGHMVIYCGRHGNLRRSDGNLRRHMIVSGGLMTTFGWPHAARLPHMTPLLCTLHCLDNCSSAIYSVKTQACKTFKEKFYNSGVLLAKAQDSYLLYKVSESS